MPETFAKLIKQYECKIVSAWVDEIYAEKRTELPARLTYEQLVGHLPDLLDILADILDDGATEGEILVAARRVRSHAQVRFYQGVLIDEVARELMIFRNVFEDFLWREGVSATAGSLWDLREALRHAGRFIDEAILQCVVIYAASLRPPVETRISVWPPPRRRAADYSSTDEDL